MTFSHENLLLCKLCDSDNLQLLFNGNFDSQKITKFSQYAIYGDILKCKNCGFITEKQSHDIEKINEYLSKEEYGDETIGKLNLSEKSRSYSPLVNIIENHHPISGSTLLDVGANTGVFMNLARSLGGFPQGLEPSIEAANTANSHFNLNIQNGVISEIDFPSNSFDIITMWDVVEHLYDPIIDLKTLQPKLRSGGYIFVSTHNIDHAFCKILGKHNPLLMYQHFHHFNPSTLQAALSKAGFEPLGVRYFYKSWSMKYLLALFDEFWPNSIQSACARIATTAISPFEFLNKLRLIFPFNLFFTAIARRP